MGKINPRQNEPKQQNMKWKEPMKEVFEMTSVRIFDIAVAAFYYRFLSTYKNA